MVVVDTHVLVWWSTGTGRLSKRAAAALAGADAIGVPAIVFWEVSLLARRARLDLGMQVGEWAEAVLSIPRVRELPLTAAIALGADAIVMHADPADRFIVATARASAAPLVTKDHLLRGLGIVTTVW